MKSLLKICLLFFKVNVQDKIDTTGSELYLKVYKYDTSKYRVQYFVFATQRNALNDVYDTKGNNKLFRKKGNSHLRCN